MATLSTENRMKTRPVHGVWRILVWQWVGTTMIAISAVLSNLKLDPIFGLTLVWSFVLSGYGFCIALPYGAWVGHRGLSIEGPSQNKVVYAGNMVGAIGSLIGTLILILGCLNTLV